MGHKVNPIGLRLGINRTWDSRWYADDGYGDLLHEDLLLRKFLRKRLSPGRSCRASSSSARPRRPG